MNTAGMITAGLIVLLIFIIGPFITDGVEGGVKMLTSLGAAVVIVAVASAVGYIVSALTNHKDVEKRS